MEVHSKPEKRARTDSLRSLGTIPRETRRHQAGGLSEEPGINTWSGMSNVVPDLFGMNRQSMPKVRVHLFQTLQLSNPDGLMETRHGVGMALGTQSLRVASKAIPYRALVQ